MKRTLIVVMIVVASLALTVGLVKAASMTVDSLTVGKQGVGGVTYFNGTIVNNTTGTGGADNPVTFGDNVRIDGSVYRGAAAGSGDSKPFKINDDGEVTGNLTVSGNTTIGGDLTVTGGFTYGGVVPLRQKVYSGTIDVTQDGDEIVNTVASSCSVPTGYKNYSYHYKKVAVPEVDAENLNNIRVYTKPSTSFPINLYPNSGDVWGGASYVYYTDGYVYFSYKYSVNLCDDTSTFYYFSTGVYQINVIY